jgi:hypothetical protein
MELEEFHYAQSRHKFWKTAHRSFENGLQVISPCWTAAGLCSLDFAHIPVVHDSHMTIVPGDRDRIPTRLSDNAPVSSITLPANASALLEVLRFGGGHVAAPLAWVAHIVGQIAWRCLSYFPINGKIVVRLPKTQTEEPAQTPARENPRREYNRDRRKYK